MRADEVTKGRLPLVLLVGLTVCVFSPVFTADFVWDDIRTIAHNPQFNPPTWSALGYQWKSTEMDIYMPLTRTVWIAIATVARVSNADENGYQLNPYLFHAANLFIHIGSVLLVYSLLRRILGSPLAAIVGAGIFAAHPLQVEPVAWISGLKDVLCGMLCLAALRLWIEPARNPVFNSLLFVLALLSKPSAVALPVVAAAIGIFAFRWSLKTTILRLRGWILLAIIFAIIAAHAQPARMVQSPWRLRPIVAADAVVFYIHKIIWSSAMGIDYGRTPQFVSRTAVWPICAVAALLLLAGALARRRFPMLVAAEAIFLAALLPVLGLVRFDFQQFSTVADHYIYFAMLGPALGLAWLARQWRWVRAVSPLIILTLGVMTYQQCQYWKNARALFAHAVEVNPNSSMSWSNLGDALAETQPAEAIADCRRAAEINPLDANNWNTLGSILMSQGDPPGAVAAFSRACELAPDNPLYAGNYRRATGSSGN